MITLTNGCACCAVSADLTNSLIAIAEREDPPDAIVLEASGIADPYGIVQVALANPSIRLDGSLVVVDAETMQALAADSSTSRLFHNQISAADLIVLSKVDLLDDAQRAEARDWLRALYPGTRVIEAVNGDVPVELVLGIDTTRHLRDGASKPTDHAHTFESVSVTIDEPLDGDRLQAFFDAPPEALLRAKGVLNLAEEPTRRTITNASGNVGAIPSRSHGATSHRIRVWFSSVRWDRWMGRRWKPVSRRARSTGPFRRTHVLWNRGLPGAPGRLMRLSSGDRQTPTGDQPCNCLAEISIP